MRWHIYHLASLIRSCTPLPKAMKPVWAKCLTQLPCLAVYVKFQPAFTTTSKKGSLLLLASTSSNVLDGWGSEKAFNGCLGGSNVFPSAD